MRIYRQLCRASHIDTHDMSGPLILLQIWIWDRFPYIALNRLHITPNGDQVLVVPLAIQYICKITLNVTIMIILKVLVYCSCLFIICFVFKFIQMKR